MADIQYLNYGDLQIELLALLNNLANNVQSYVLKQSWSNKRKEKFMSAYTDLMNKGILGASNTTGQWVININDSIPFDTMDKKDKEMYLEAAYFILLQMAGLPTKASQELEQLEDKSKLPVFEFNNSFKTHVNKSINGGNPLNIGYGDSDQWNYLDERDPNTGIRGRVKRSEKLAELLESYKRDVSGDGSKFNFEGSPYSDINDFNTKIDTAIAALRNSNIDDDRSALLTIGLNQADWFNNGSGDPYKTEGYEGTYGDYYLNYLPRLEKKKLEEQTLKTKQALLNAYNNKTFIGAKTSSKMLGANRLQLKEKYGTNDTLVQALYSYSLKNLRDLTPLELSELHGAYRYLAKNPIDNKTLKILLNMSSGMYRDAAPNRFKKINGINNLIYDTVGNQVIQLLNRQLFEASKNNPKEDLFAGILTLLEKENEYLNSKIPGITNAEWKELSAIGLDIASIINPEAITGSLMSLGAADLRRRAKNDSNPDWSFGDYFWQGVDYLTGALGGIQVLGDAVLGAKTIATASKAIPILRKMARLGAWNDLLGQIPDLAEATRKVTTGEELTVKDWRAIGQGIRGLVSHGRMNRQNLAERKVIKESGYTPEQASSIMRNVNKWRGKEGNLYGFTRSRVPSTGESISTLKVKVNNEDVELKLTKDLKNKIQENVRKAGKSEEARNNVLKKELKGKEFETTDGKKVKIEESSTISSKAPSNLRDNRLLSFMRLDTSKDLFGTYNPTVTRTNDNFNTWLNDRSKFDQYNPFSYGSNRELKGIRNRLGIEDFKSTSHTPKVTPEDTSETTLHSSTEKNTKVKQSTLSKEESKELLSTLRGKNFSTNEFKDESRVVGSVKGFGDLYGIRNSDGTHTLEIDFGGTRVNITGTKADIKGKTLEVLRKDIMKRIDILIPKKNRSKIKFELIKQLKLNGYLKQGGTIDKQKIQQYKEFINK